MLVIRLLLKNMSKENKIINWFVLRIINKIYFIKEVWDL